MDSETGKHCKSAGDLPHLYRLMDFATHRMSTTFLIPSTATTLKTCLSSVDDGCRGLFETIRANEGCYGNEPPSCVTILHILPQHESVQIQITHEEKE